MLTEHSGEDDFIKSFLSAHESGTWADAKFTKPDAIDRTNPAVDQLATRKCDGKTLAVEHTIIELFVGDKEDFAFLETAFFGIENDKSLLVPGRWIQVLVPVGTLRNQPKKARHAIVQSVHRWIKSNRFVLRDGASQHPCAITGIPGRLPFDITLNVKVVPLQRGSAAAAGILHVRRQHMNLYPQSMLDEIEKRRASFPGLAHVDEIWIGGTIFYGTAFGGTYLRFELYENDNEVRSFDFDGGKLVMKSEDDVGEVIRQEP